MGLEMIGVFRKEKEMTLDELAEKSGVPVSTIKKISAGITTDPNLSTVQAIADALECTVDDLSNTSRFVDTFSISERKLIKKYRSLDPYGKKAVDSVLDIEWRRVEHAKEMAKTDTSAEMSGTIIDLNKIIPFRLSLQPASAGTGFLLGPEEFKTIYIKRNELTRRASFGVPVSGDSMEPDYHDGDVLLLERAEDIRIGEVGVFTISGEGYVKECGNGELISLNPVYPPIPINEGIRCNGRVIGILEPGWIVEK